MRHVFSDYRYTCYSFSENIATPTKPYFNCIKEQRILVQGLQFRIVLHDYLHEEDHEGDRVELDRL